MELNRHSRKWAAYQSIDIGVPMAGVTLNPAPSHSSPIGKPLTF